MAGQLTLSVDCGGLFLKSCVLDNSGTMHGKLERIETPYPLPPARFVDTIGEIAAGMESRFAPTFHAWFQNYQEHNS